MHKSDPFWQVQPWRKEQKRAKAKVLRWTKMAHDVKEAKDFH